MRKQRKKIIKLKDPMKSSVLICLVLLLSSCNSISMYIAKKTGDFQEPQKETPESIKLYCSENRVNYNELFIVQSEDQFASFIEKHKHLPGIFVFDSNKYLITTAVKSNCPWTMINFLYDTTIPQKRVENTELFDEIMANFTLINSTSEQKSPDYYILCTWAKYTPKHTKSLFETINKQKQENKLNVCHILLNVDLQESWDKN
jgi:hypothetical protein